MLQRKNKKSVCKDWLVISLLVVEHCFLVVSVHYLGAGESFPIYRELSILNTKELSEVYSAY